jgi:hypothetical protein
MTTDLLPEIVHRGPVPGRHATLPRVVGRMGAKMQHPKLKLTVYLSREEIATRSRELGVGGP